MEFTILGFIFLVFVAVTVAKGRTGLKSKKAPQRVSTKQRSGKSS